MSRIETYAKFKVHPGREDQFRAGAAALSQAARSSGQAPVRLDWFVIPDATEAAAIAVFEDGAAHAAHLAQFQEDYRALAAISEVSIDLLGDAGAERLESAFGGAPVHQFWFDGGIIEPPSISGGDGFIEIFTRFTIHPGEEAAFKSIARENLQIVRDHDPGTPRYDWYYDKEGRECLALDSYADTAAMLAHMKNSHDPHEELLKRSAMITEFLGALPDDAFALVAKFDPYILHFECGLGHKSAGASVLAWPSP